MNVDLIFKKGDGKYVKRDIMSLKTEGCFGLYFSAEWCNPCKEFTALLRKFHKITQYRRNPREKMHIIFVSLDNDAKSMLRYYKNEHGQWYATPFGHSINKFLSDKYNVKTIPSLIILNKDWKLITSNGCDEIRQCVSETEDNKPVEEMYTELYSDWLGFNQS